MSKNGCSNNKELNIFESELGRMEEFEYDLKQAISNVIRKYIRQDSKRSRHTLAGELSHLLNRSISKEMLDQYCSTAKTDYHPHADLVATICMITGSKKPLEVFGSYLHYSILNDSEMTYVDLVETTREIKKLERKKKELEHKLEAGNG